MTNAMPLLNGNPSARPRRQLVGHPRVCATSFRLALASHRSVDRSYLPLGLQKSNEIMLEIFL